MTACNIVWNNHANNLDSAIFQAGGLVVVLVEVTRKAYLASIVPVIVNTILNEHQVIVDIVAFVSQGDFPKSRLGEKQRGKILASWVTRKLRTIAQFSIRDADASDTQIAEIPEPRSSRSSKPGSTMGNSTRRLTMAPDSDFMAVPRSPAQSQEVRGPEGPPSRVASQASMQQQWQQQQQQQQLQQQQQQELQQQEDKEKEEEQQRQEAYQQYDEEYQALANAPRYQLTDAPVSSDIEPNFDFDDEIPAPAPLSIMNPDVDDSPSTITGLNFGSDFRDGESEHTARQADIPSVELSPPVETPPAVPDKDPLHAVASMPARGRDSLPSQQRRNSSLPAGFSALKISEDGSSAQEGQRSLSQGSLPKHEEHNESEEEWPQEALLYQKHLGINSPGKGDGNGVGRSPSTNSSIVRKRYDGSDYDFY